MNCFRSTNKAKQLILAQQYCQGYGDPDGFEVRFIDDFIGKQLIDPLDVTLHNV